LKFSVVVHVFKTEPVFEVLALDAEVSLVVDEVGDAVPLEELGCLPTPLPYADSYTGTKDS
jgi:hypothetical protein